VCFAAVAGSAGRGRDAAGGGIMDGWMDSPFIELSMVIHPSHSRRIRQQAGLRLDVECANSGNGVLTTHAAFLDYETAQGVEHALVA
jgi:hypothetical protein